MKRALTTSLQLLGAVLVSGCATSGPSSRVSHEGELDTVARLAAIEIRLEQVAEKLAVIQAFATGKYVVRSGDTAAAIARLLDVPLSDLEKLNPAVPWNRLRIGELIKIREGEPNKPSAGNAGRASPFQVGHHRPGVPEPGR